MEITEVQAKHKSLINLKKYNTVIKVMQSAKEIVPAELHGHFFVTVHHILRLYTRLDMRLHLTYWQSSLTGHTTNRG